MNIEITIRLIQTVKKGMEKENALNLTNQGIPKDCRSNDNRGSNFRGSRSNYNGNSYRDRNQNRQNVVLVGNSTILEDSNAFNVGVLTTNLEVGT